jgi:hypothetical protein
MADVMNVSALSQPVKEEDLSDTGIRWKMPDTSKNTLYQLTITMLRL